jgi:hypothetical protein
LRPLWLPKLLPAVHNKNSRSAYDLIKSVVAAIALTHSYESHQAMSRLLAFVAYSAQDGALRAEAFASSMIPL